MGFGCCRARVGLKMAILFSDGSERRTKRPALEGKKLNLEKTWFEDARDGFVVIWWQARKDGNTRNPAMHETI